MHGPCRQTEVELGKRGATIRPPPPAAENDAPFVTDHSVQNSVLAGAEQPGLLMLLCLAKRRYSSLYTYPGFLLLYKIEKLGGIWKIQPRFHQTQLQAQQANNYM